MCPTKNRPRKGKLTLDLPKFLIFNRNLSSDLNPYLKKISEKFVFFFYICNTYIDTETHTHTQSQ